MKKISSMLSNSIDKNYESYINTKVLKDSDIQNFISKNSLTDEQVETNIEKFYEYYIAKKMKDEFNHQPILLIKNNEIYIQFEETPEYSEQRLNLEFDRRIKTEFIPKKVLKSNFDNLRSSGEKIKLSVEIINLCDNILINSEKKGLYIYGETGIGKTYLMGCIYNYFKANGIEPAILYYPEFVRKLKSMISTGGHTMYIDQLRQEKILIIDDIGAENITDYVRDEVLGPIINYREAEELPTFFSSNLSYDALLDTISQTKNSVDMTRSFRIIQRIRAISRERKLVGINERDFT